MFYLAIHDFFIPEVFDASGTLGSGRSLPTELGLLSNLREYNGNSILVDDRFDLVGVSVRTKPDEMTNPPNLLRFLTLFLVHCWI